MHNGTIANIEEWFRRPLERDRSCQSHQDATYGPVWKVLEKTSLASKKIKIYRNVIFIHHAVIVFPKGSDWKKTGVVLDGWVRQDSTPDRMTFLFKDWNRTQDVGVALEDDADNLDWKAKKEPQSLEDVLRRRRAAERRAEALE